MAKTNSQKFHDDLETLLDKYPNMKVSQVLATTQTWMDSVFRRLRKEGLTKVTVCRNVKGRYRLG